MPEAPRKTRGRAVVTTTVSAFCRGVIAAAAGTASSIVPSPSCSEESHDDVPVEPIAVVHLHEVDHLELLAVPTSHALSDHPRAAARCHSAEIVARRVDEVVPVRHRLSVRPDRSTFLPPPTNVERALRHRGRRTPSTTWFRRIFRLGRLSRFLGLDPVLRV